MTPSTLIVIGGNPSFNYLLQRYAERAGYSITRLPASVTIDILLGQRPLAVVFPSLENLEDAQSFAAGLVNGNVPIIVCSSVGDQARAWECGADYCLVHPFVYDNFSSVLRSITSREGDDEAAA